VQLGAGHIATIPFKREGDKIILIGDNKGHLGASLYLKEVLCLEEGAPPPVDLKAEKRNGEFVSALIQGGQVDTCHDISDGGLAISLSEMAMSSKMGADIMFKVKGVQNHGALFGEDQSRFIITVPMNLAAEVISKAVVANISALIIGDTGGDRLKINNIIDISVSELNEVNQSWFPNFMRSTS